MTPAERLEHTLWDTFWAPPDLVVIDRPELYLTCCPRDLPAHNVVSRVRASTEAQVERLVREVVQAHQGKAGARCMLGDSSRHPALAQVLVQAGYEPEHRHRGAWSTAEAEAPPDPGGPTVRPVATREDLLGWLSVRADAFGEGQAGWTEASLAADLAGCTGDGARTQRFVAWSRDGRALSAGSVNLYPHLRTALLWGGGTLAEARGRGLYRSVVAARVAWARARGMEVVGLFAREHTSLPVVERLGFAQGGRLDTWVPAARPDRFGWP